MVKLDLNPTRYVESHTVGNYAAFVAQDNADESLSLFVFDEGKNCAIRIDDDTLSVYDVNKSTIEAFCLEYDLVPVAYLLKGDFAVVARVE